ncbi:AraC family transcriptional regulator [Sessilibacter corallicola]|uniref:AraC family transcriptional regulator n=1 Tax=Sessilibacter corallicola TaxID=2904075 RepID=UPI001E3E4A09|nr:AraC family transcriptional regulator [Sessilibacter corallicola]MCE2028893.1 AraC family transcriptional regulator [Sessilibacter corallicola]
MDVEPSLSPRFIAYIRDFLLDRGVDPRPYFAEANLSVCDDGELAPSIPVSKIAKLFEVVANATDYPSFGVELSRGYHFESASVITLALMAAPTVEDSLSTLVRYDKYVDSAISIDLTKENNLSFFSLQLISPPGCNLKYLNEYLIYYVVFAMQKATRMTMPIKNIWFTHSGSECEDERHFMSELYGAPVRYRAPLNGIFFDESFLKKPLSTANNLLYEILCNSLKNHYSQGSGHYDFFDTVSREILLQIKKQEATMTSVANSLLMTERTLRRRLLEEGLSFKQMKKKARERRAQYFLKYTKLSVTEISYELGFSEPSAFCRAFRSWTGKTPAEYKSNETYPISVPS